MTHIDAIVLSASEAHSALLALVENLQREDLHFFEEAEGYAAVLAGSAMTQEALAERIGSSQSAIANKLRLLKLDPAVRAQVRAAALSERHARALLRLPLTSLQLDAAHRMVEQQLSVKQADALVASLLAAVPVKERKARRIITLIRDQRLYINAIRDIVRQMQSAGYAAVADIKEREGMIEVLVRIPGRKGVSSASGPAPPGP